MKAIERDQLATNSSSWASQMLLNFTRRAGASSCQTFGQDASDQNVEYGERTPLLKAHQWQKSGPRYYGLFNNNNNHNNWDPSKHPSSEEKQPEIQRGEEQQQPQQQPFNNHHHYHHHYHHQHFHYYYHRPPLNRGWHQNSEQHQSQAKLSNLYENSNTFYATEPLVQKKPHTTILIHDDSYINPSEVDKSTSWSSSLPSTPKGNQEPKLKICELRLMSIILMSVVGFIIASYLLIMESRLPKIAFTLDLVNYEVWSKVPKALRASDAFNHSNVSNVLMTHTGGDTCDDPESCLRILTNLQTKEMRGVGAMSFNFLIGGDGQTYEVHGWDYMSGLDSISQPTTLVIGFIGNYTNLLPNVEQLRSALSLIKESVRRKKLSESYQIYGLRNVTASESDAETLLKHITNWPRFQSLLFV